MMEVTNFNLRVYGILIRENHILITDECRGGMQMTKFPGGGLEKGEGLADGLKREFMEELDLPIQVGDLFYVNDFLQISQFNQQDQLLSFYYHVETAENAFIQTVNKKSDVLPNEQHFRWLPIADLDKEELTFPVDRVVQKKLFIQLK